MPYDDLPTSPWEMEQAMSLMIPCPICRAAPGKPCVFVHCDAITPGAPRHPHESRLQPARETLRSWRREKVSV